MNITKEQAVKLGKQIATSTYTNRHYLDNTVYTFNLEALHTFCNAAIEHYIAQQAAKEPVAYLWQHSETGRTRILSTGDRFTDDGRWFQVGPLYLGVKV